MELLNPNLECTVHLVTIGNSLTRCTRTTSGQKVLAVGWKPSDFHDSLFDMCKLHVHVHSVLLFHCMESCKMLRVCEYSATSCCRWNHTEHEEYMYMYNVHVVPSFWGQRHCTLHKKMKSFCVELKAVPTSFIAATKHKNPTFDWSIAYIS